MKALLRFQAIVLARTFSNAVVLALVVTACVAALAAPAARERNLGDAYAVIAFAALASFAVWGMGCTFGALDQLHWSTPASRAGVLRTHFVFWGAVCGPPAAAAAIVHAKGDPTAAALSFLVLTLLTGAAAAHVVVIQRWRRSGTVDSALPALLLPIATVAPAFWAILLAYSGQVVTGALASGGVFVVSTTLAARLYRGDEFLPQSTETADPRDLLSDRRKTRTPAATARAATHPVVRWMAFVTAIGAQFVPVSGWFPFPAIFVLLAAPGGSAVDLSSCRWLFATPMERGRIFRRLFLPAVLVAVAAAAARVCVLELRPDRTVFFDTYRGSGKPQHHEGALRLGDVLRIRERTRKAAGEPSVEVLGTEGRSEYASPEPPFMAARVRECLRTRYGLDVPAERIEASILRGWHLDPSAHPNDRVWSEQAAVFDAMDRVGADLEDEIVGADRRRNVLCGSVLALACIFLLRQKAAHGARQWKGEGVVHMLVLVALFVPQIWPHSSATAALTAAALAVEAPVQQASAFVAALLVIAVPVAAFLLWRSAERAFRQTDITDLPATTGPSGWSGRAA